MANTGLVFTAAPQQVFDDSDNDDKVSLWVKEKDVFVPSTDIEILKQLPAGMYKISYTNDRGYFCKEINLQTDELFDFTDSMIVDLLDEINTFWDKAELFKKNKLVHKRGILLSGYAGTGKTTIINMASKNLIDNGGIVFKISGIRNLSDYVDFIKHGFRKIQEDTPIITILEDIDQYGDVEMELLDFLDGQYHLNHHIVIATSNNTENIPDTFLRPSRLDLKIEIGYPSEQTRREYFKHKNMEDTKIEQLLPETKDCSLADLKEIFICTELLGYSAEEALNQVLNPTEKRNYLISKNQKSKIGL